MSLVVLGELCFRYFKLDPFIRNSSTSHHYFSKNYSAWFITHILLSRASRRHRVKQKPTKKWFMYFPDIIISDAPSAYSLHSHRTTTVLYRVVYIFCHQKQKACIHRKPPSAAGTFGGVIWIKQFFSNSRYEINIDVRIPKQPYTYGMFTDPFIWNLFHVRNMHSSTLFHPSMIFLIRNIRKSGSDLCVQFLGFRIHWLCLRYSCSSAKTRIILCKLENLFYANMPQECYAW